MAQEHSHSGHRERMRSRLRECMSLDGFAEHEILEMLLFYVFPRGNTNEIAHSLLNRFGSIKGVLQASESELVRVNDVGENCALAMKFFNMLISYVSRQELGNVDVRDYSRMMKYVETFFCGEKKEKIKVFCINNSGRVQSCLYVGTGSSDKVQRGFKDLTNTILNSGCNYAAIAHNHPGADNTPSQEDIILTRKLINYLNLLDIQLLDHYVVGDNGTLSMRSCGFIYEV